MNIKPFDGEGLLKKVMEGKLPRCVWWFTTYRSKRPSEICITSKVPLKLRALQKLFSFASGYLKPNTLDEDRSQILLFLIKVKEAMSSCVGEYLPELNPKMQEISKHSMFAVVSSRTGIVLVESPYTYFPPQGALSYVITS